MTYANFIITLQSAVKTNRARKHLQQTLKNVNKKQTDAFENKTETVKYPMVVDKRTKLEIVNW
jgi:hypothetical protein